MKDPHEAYNEHVSSVEEALPDNPTTTGEEILKDVKANSPYAMVREHAAQALDNPATGEWTVDWLYEYARQREGYKTICELHNAEREKFKQEYELHLATIEYTADLREQLAAEREKWKQENALHLQAVGYYGASQKALAAEREKAQQCAIEGSGWQIEAQQLRDQLAAEQSKFKGMCDAYAESHEILKQQLAAERERVVSVFAVDAANSEEIIKNLQDNADIAVKIERETIRELVDALKQIVEIGTDEHPARQSMCEAIAEAALAKVKEGK